MGPFVGPLQQHARDARIRVPKLAQLRIVGDHHEGVFRVEDAGRLEQRVDRQRAKRMERTDLIPDNAVDECSAELRKEVTARIFVYGADDVAPTVIGLEVQRDRLPVPPPSVTGSARRLRCPG